MWRFDLLARLIPAALWRKRPAACLRVGRRAVELWSPAADGLALAASAPLPGHAWDQPSHLATVIVKMGERFPAARGAELVLESAWLPLLLAETGGGLVSQSQAEALVRHRLGRLHDTPADPVAAWDVRVDFHGGDSHALGYGLSPRVQQALAQAAQTLGVKWRAVTPAFSWARDWAWPRFKAAGCFADRSVWWAWQEQDRWLLAHVDKPGAGSPRITGLHPAVGDVGDAAAWRRQVQAETVRLGFRSATPSAPGLICIGAWDAAPTPSSKVDADLRWLCVGDGSPVVPHSSSGQGGRSVVSGGQPA